MAKLDLEWLQVFEEVYQRRSISRAAEHLGIAQASASVALQKLRDHFDDQLFTRTPAGMQPTAYAEEIRSDIATVLALLLKARQARSDFDPATSARTFRLCATDIRLLVMLPQLVTTLAQAAPRTRIHADLMSEDTPRLMAEGQIELAIGHLPHVEHGFLQRTLRDEDFVCLAAAQHPRIRAPLSLEAALAERQIQVSVSGSGTGPSIVDKALAERNLRMVWACAWGVSCPWAVSSRSRNCWPSCHAAWEWPWPSANTCRCSMRPSSFRATRSGSIGTKGSMRIRDMRGSGN